MALRKSAQFTKRTKFLVVPATFCSRLEWQSRLYFAPIVASQSWPHSFTKGCLSGVEVEQVLVHESSLPSGQRAQDDPAGVSRYSRQPPGRRVGCSDSGARRPIVGTLSPRVFRRASCCRKTSHTHASFSFRSFTTSARLVGRRMRRRTFNSHQCIPTPPKASNASQSISSHPSSDHATSRTRLTPSNNACQLSVRELTSRSPSRFMGVGA